jgi:hypothetical protein
MFKTSDIEDTSNTKEQPYQSAETQMEPRNLEELLDVIHPFKITKHPEQT